MFGTNGGPVKTPRLEPKHLYEKRIARDNSKLKSYNQILSQIHARIYHTSQLSGNTNYLVYTVPPFVLGLPSIDLQDCIVYLVHQLRQSGFLIRYTYPNLLYISWKHYEAEYNRQQNPIVQAMMPASTSKKGKEGKRGEAAAPPITFGSSAQAPPRSTTEYMPPDSFLQGITRPATAPIGNGVPKAPERDVLADLWKFA